jgi:fatty-acyl-CoA synthase
LKITDTLAKGLLSIGVKKGDKVALWLNNRPEWIFFYFAIAKIGAVIVPVNTRFKMNDLEYVLKHSDSTVLVLGTEFRGVNYYEIFSALVPDIVNVNEGNLSSGKLPLLKTVITVGEPYPGTLGYEELLERGRVTEDNLLKQRESEVQPDDLVAIYYTSGTTGFPKGAMHSHKMIANMRDAAARFEMNSNDRILLFLPLFHIYASQVGMTAAFTRGVGLVLMEAFHAGEALKLIEQKSVTIIYGFDTMYYDMMNHPDFQKYSRQSLRTGLCPAAPHVTKLVIENFCKVLNGYGMTEATGLTSLSFLTDSTERIISSNGFPMPGLQVKIVDPVTRIEFPRNERGELSVKGHPVTLGYYKNPEETRKVMDEDGWFYTGDLGYIDDQGYLHIIGRIKDIIRVGAENVDPVEVEAVLSEHEAINRAYVVSRPDTRLGEVCIAFVQRNQGYDISEEEIISFCKNKIASFKVPRSVYFVDEFPMTPTGKIQKYILRERALQLMEQKDEGSQKLLIKGDQD